MNAALWGFLGALLGGVVAAVVSTSLQYHYGTRLDANRRQLEALEALRQAVQHSTSALNEWQRAREANGADESAGDRAADKLATASLDVLALVAQVDDSEITAWAQAFRASMSLRFLDAYRSSTDEPLLSADGYAAVLKSGHKMIGARIGEGSAARPHWLPRRTKKAANRSPDA